MCSLFLFSQLAFNENRHPTCHTYCYIFFWGGGVQKVHDLWCFFFLVVHGPKLSKSRSGEIYNSRVKCSVLLFGAG